MCQTMDRIGEATRQEEVTVSKKFKFLMYANDTTIYFNLEVSLVLMWKKMCQMN